MLRIITILIALFGLTFADENDTLCDGIESKDFSLDDVLGTWYVAGVVTYGQKIPERANPCFRVEFFEADEAGLRWLMNNNTNANESDYWSSRVKGTTVRQRYHIDHPYDTWSRTLEDSIGCFEEVLTIYSEEKRIFKLPESNSNTTSSMQLHILATEDGLGPYLLQLLWGDKLSAVIYRRRPGRVTHKELDPVMTLLDKIRVGQILTFVCERTPIKPRQKI